MTNDFSPNLKGVAQKIGPLHPFEVLDTFGGKSKSKPPKDFKSSTYRVIHNYWYGNKRLIGGLRMVVQKIYVKVNFYTFIKASFNIK